MYERSLTALVGVIKSVRTLGTSHYWNVVPLKQKKYITLLTRAGFCWSVVSVFVGSTLTMHLTAAHSWAHRGSQVCLLFKQGCENDGILKWGGGQTLCCSRRDRTHYVFNSLNS